MADIHGTIGFLPVSFKVRNRDRFDETLGEWIPEWNAHHVSETGGMLSCQHGHRTQGQARACGKRYIGKVIDLGI